MRDNSEAVNRRHLARFAYEPNTCKSGFVWGEADDWDWICLDPTVRTQIPQR